MLEHLAQILGIPQELFPPQPLADHTEQIRGLSLCFHPRAGNEDSNGRRWVFAHMFDDPAPHLAHFFLSPVRATDSVLHF